MGSLLIVDCRCETYQGSKLIQQAYMTRKLAYTISHRAFCMLVAAILVCSLADVLSDLALDSEVDFLVGVAGYTCQNKGANKLVNSSDGPSIWVVGMALFV